CWAKHAAQLELLPASTAAFEIRAPNILRPRSERNYLLDDADGNGPIDPSRVLDDWAERERSGLQAAKDGAFKIAGYGSGGRAAEHARVENILSTGRYETVSAEAATALAKGHYDRSMVLGRGGGSGWRISRPVEKIRLRTVSRSSEARAEGEI